MMMALFSTKRKITVRRFRGSKMLPDITKLPAAAAPGDAPRTDANQRAQHLRLVRQHRAELPALFRTRRLQKKTRRDFFARKATS